MRAEIKMEAVSPATTDLTEVDTEDNSLRKSMDDADVSGSAIQDVEA